MSMNNLSLVFGYTIIILLCALIRNFSCQRRIEDGSEVTEPKRYAVYLIKAPEESPQQYDEWICGGAIVSEYYVVTSAACVKDVKHLYIISGYNKYVKDDEIDKDPCTKHMKKRVVYTCTPKSYDFDYYKIDKWANIDIALVKVDDPFDFNDKTYEEKCSYIPAPIKINYENMYQQPNRDAMVLGWGHSKIYRKPENTQLLNLPKLNYAPVLLTEKEVCKKAYSIFENMPKIIDRYMLCTQDKGNIDDKGDTISTSAPIAEGCGPGMLRIGGKCEEKYDDDIGILYARKNLFDSLLNHSSLINDSKMYEALLMTSSFRRSGICQNDHGGPLVTWVGSHEILIGVASMFLIGNNDQCSGPYLFTSTQCNGAFLHCMLSKHNSKGFRRFDFCDIPESQRDYDVTESLIEWRSHPNWTDANETAVENSIVKEILSTANTNKTELTSITKTVDNITATRELIKQTKKYIPNLTPVINNTTTLERTLVTHKVENIIDGIPKSVNQIQENITTTITPEINKITQKEKMLPKATIS